MKPEMVMIHSGSCVTAKSGRYQSGQMGQTVNLLAQPSEVRILLSPRKKMIDRLPEAGDQSFSRK